MAKLLPGLQQSHRSAITVVRSQDARACGHLRNQKIERSHSARRDDGTSASFEPGERVGEQIAGRIARAAIVVAARLFKAGERIGARQIERRRHSAERRVARDAMRGCNRLGAERLVCVNH